MSKNDSSTSDEFLYAYVLGLDAYAAAKETGVAFSDVAELRRRPEVVDAMNDRLAELEQLSSWIVGGRVLGLMVARAGRSGDLRDLLGAGETVDGYERLRELLTSAGVGGDTWAQEVDDGSG